MAETFKLSNLTDEEAEQLCMAPVWVTLLIAGADDKIDDKELREAMQLVQNKRGGGSEAIRSLYSKVDQYFENNLKGYMALFSENGKARRDYLYDQLTKIGGLLKKTDRHFAVEYYNGLRDFSMTVATASGGIFGIGTINKEEAELINLPMIENPGEMPL